MPPLAPYCRRDSSEKLLLSVTQLIDAGVTFNWVLSTPRPVLIQRPESFLISMDNVNLLHLLFPINYFSLLSCWIINCLRAKGTFFKSWHLFYLVKCKDWKWFGSKIRRCNRKVASIVPLFSGSLECPLEIPPEQCSPVSVLDRQVLFHSFHQVPEALGKHFLLGERLAVYQACSQLIEILLGDRVASGSGSNSKPCRKEVARGQAGWGLLVLTDAQGFASRSTLNFLSLEKT